MGPPPPPTHTPVYTHILHTVTRFTVGYAQLVYTRTVTVLVCTVGYVPFTVYGCTVTVTRGYVYTHAHTHVVPTHTHAHTVYALRSFTVYVYQIQLSSLTCISGARQCLCLFPPTLFYVAWWWLCELWLLNSMMGRMILPPLPSDIPRDWACWKWFFICRTEQRQNDCTARAATTTSHPITTSVYKHGQAFFCSQHEQAYQHLLHLSTSLNISHLHIFPLSHYLSHSLHYAHRHYVTHCKEDGVSLFYDWVPLGHWR